MFPPARLSLREALHQYAEHKATPESWMLSRFLLPAGQAAQFPTTGGTYGTNEALPVSIIGTRGESVELMLECLRQDLQAVFQSDAFIQNRISPQLFEMYFPVTGLDDDEIVSALSEIRHIQQETHAAALGLFLEVNWRGALSGDVAKLADAIRRSNEARESEWPPFGLKIRCGGITPEEVPDITSLAAALDDWSRQGVSLKATAGLHHPFRHFRTEFNGWMHGFVNLFVAAMMARVHQLNLEQLAEILSATDPESFLFKNDTIQFGDWILSSEAIRHERASGLLSYGSCSFDEPRDDLHSHGLL